MSLRKAFVLAVLMVALVAVSSFQPLTSRPSFARISSASHRTNPLFLASDPEKEEPETTGPTPTRVLNEATGEEYTPKWVDPALGAQTNPFQLSWWGYLLVGYVALVYLNDFVHFLPEEGPLSFISGH
uniref:Uncharacterized protein n=1 Tax=Trieres chinensis TaxID=1514140 RepID=A0A7S2A382_TRICV